jgi:hypothetical protein
MTSFYFEIESLISFIATILLPVKVMNFFVCFCFLTGASRVNLSFVAFCSSVSSIIIDDSGLDFLLFSSISTGSVLKKSSGAESLDDYSDSDVS